MEATQLQILVNIDELSLPSVMVEGITKPSDEERVQHSYQANSQFDSPVLIRGTNRQLVPSGSVVTFSEVKSDVLGSVIEACREVEDTFELVTVQRLSQISIKEVLEDFIIISVDLDEDEVEFAVPTPKNEEKISKEAFHNFSTILGIPYSFSKKNPAHLNDANFQYWQKELAKDVNKPIGIDILFQKEKILIEGREISIAVNIFKANTTKGTVTRPAVVHKSKLESKVPLFSRILEGVVEEMKGSSLEPKLQSYSLAYNGLNKGQFYSRLIFEGQGSEIEVGGEKFTLYLDMTSDFTGRKKDFGKVKFQFGYFRFICSNGLVVRMNNDQAEELIESMGAGMEVEVEGDSLGMKQVIRNIATGAGSTISVANANMNFKVLGLKKYFEVLEVANSKLVENLEELDVEFKNVSADAFIESSMSLMKQLKISSRVINFLNIEYMVDQMDGQEKKLGSPLDVLNFLTFICKSFSTDIQVGVEKNAYSFAVGLKKRLIDKIEDQKKLGEPVRNRIDSDLLLSI